MIGNGFPQMRGLTSCLPLILYFLHGIAVLSQSWNPTGKNFRFTEHSNFVAFLFLLTTTCSSAFAIFLSPSTHYFFLSAGPTSVTLLDVHALTGLASHSDKSLTLHYCETHMFDDLSPSDFLPNIFVRRYMYSGGEVT